MKNPRIFIKYCGNCNPSIKAVEVVKKITDSLPGVTVLPAGNSDHDLTLLVSGCRRDCASCSDSYQKTVVIAGGSVDNEECEASELVLKALEKIKQKLNIT